MSSTTRNRNRILLALICFVSFCLRLGSVGLFDFNEGFYAQVSREMALRSDYITPRVNGLFFFDKPPFALWQSAISMKLFGATEFAARFPVAMAAICLVIAVYWFGAKFFSERAGLFAAAIVAMNPMMIGTARQLTMDIHQTLWFAVAMMAFFIGYQGQSRKHKAAFYIFYAACGFSVLAKSAPGLFPIITCFVFICIKCKFQIHDILAKVWQAKPVAGILILILVIGPWHFLAWQANGKVFYEEYWLLHHVQLLNGKDFNHAQPIWFYIPMLIGGMIPWSLFIPFAMRKPTIELPEFRINARQFALIWGVTVFIIFSLMKSKLISYLLPMYPAAALLVADWLDLQLKSDQTVRNRILALVAILTGAIGIFGFGVSRWALAKAEHNAHFAMDLAREFPPPVWDWTIHSFWIAIIGGVAAACLIIAKRTRLGVASFFVTMGAFVTLAVLEGIPAMNATKMAPLQGLARHLGQKSQEGWPVAVHIAGPRRPSVFFYMPDALFVNKPLPTTVGENGLVLERGEIEEMLKFVADNVKGQILTDTERGAKLIAAVPNMRVTEIADHWEILQFDKQAAPQ